MENENAEPPVHTIAVWFAKFATPDDCYRAFEAYGHAMATASTFEMLMALMSLKAYAQRLDKRANARINPADQTTLVASLLSGSYDKLRRRLCDSFTLSDELKKGLEDGKEARDHLAHNFWQAHAINLLSPDGVDIIASHCAAVTDHFQKLTDGLIEETGVNVDDYIEGLVNDPDRPTKHEGWQELLKAHGLA